MKQKLPILLACVCSIPALWHPSAAQTLDPTFANPSIYAPGVVNSALEQPDGKRVVTGSYSRLNGAPAYGMSRLSPNGTLDAAFQQNMGVSTGANQMRLLSNGKFLVVSYSLQPFTVGGITRQTMAQVNADGSGDAAFSIGTGPAYVTPNGSSSGNVGDFLPLPNGQIIAVGNWNSFNGAAAPVGIIRLTATGATDPTFNPGTGVGPQGKRIKIQGIFGGTHRTKRRGFVCGLGSCFRVAPAAD